MVPSVLRRQARMSTAFDRSSQLRVSIQQQAVTTHTSYWQHFSPLLDLAEKQLLLLVLDDDWNQRIGSELDAVSIEGKRLAGDFSQMTNLRIGIRNWYAIPLAVGIAARNDPRPDCTACSHPSASCRRRHSCHTATWGRLWKDSGEARRVSHRPASAPSPRSVVRPARCQPARFARPSAASLALSSGLSEAFAAVDS